MALKFLYITTDPFINQSGEFVRILTISNSPAFPVGTGARAVGFLNDENGNLAGYFQFIVNELGTEATAYPYAFSSGWSSNMIILVPPGWSFSGFGRAIAIQGSLEEVLRVN